MRSFVLAFACLGLAAPAAAQTAPAPNQAAPAAKPKMITKVVCERIDNEEVTGSRLGAAPKKCRKIKVPAPDSAQEQANRPASGNHVSGY